MNWLRDFWYHDTVAEMQRKMLVEVRRASCRGFRWWYIPTSGKTFISGGSGGSA